MDRWFISSVITLALFCCKPEALPIEDGINIFDDPEIIRIYDFADKRAADSLYKYLKHPNPKYREYAARSFGTVQDSGAREPLIALLLQDEFVEVREAAAYALGQLYDSVATSTLLDILKIEDSLFVRKTILEAIGKGISQTQLSAFNRMDFQSSAEWEGFIWGIYRAGIRNVHDDLSVQVAIGLLSPEVSYSARLGAAHFLGRTREIEIDKYLNAIGHHLTNEPSPHVRAQLARALAKSQKEDALNMLIAQATDEDSRVRIEAARSLGHFPDASTAMDTLIRLLHDEQVNVAIAAAETLETMQSDVLRKKIQSLDIDALNARAQNSLYSILLAVPVPDQQLISILKSSYGSSKSPLQKAGLLQVIGKVILEYEFLVTETFSAEHPAIATAGISALVALRQREDFPAELEEEFAEIFREAILSGDIALIGITSGALLDTTLGFKESYESHDFLYSAKENLSLPRDNEALQVLEKTIGLFEGREVPPVKNEYNNPINWDLVRQTPQNMKVRITTSKGEIVLRMLINEAPGAVANFLQLIEKGYYNGLTFHRVVPDFVVQGGCHRGDGWGGEDYSIRSELGPQRYQEGSVGMASAGKDTEGTQWFITHSPTPHLDGRYTIFAQVTEGMEVIHTLEIGDRIIDVQRVIVNE